MWRSNKAGRRGIFFITALIFFGIATRSENVLSEENRPNYSVDDVIEGFRANKLFYFEMIFAKGKYEQAFNRCVDSKPADYALMKKSWTKNPEFKNAFAYQDGDSTSLYFIYETAKKCEEIRKSMKDKMDALKK